MDKSYYIFRHGETYATKKQRWYWHELYSATILEEGKASVLRLANYLKQIDSDYNVSSPFLRCRQTSDLITQITGKEFVFDKRLGERTFEFPNRFRSRVLNFITDMENSDHRNILICTHAAVITVLLNHLSSGDPTSKQKYTAPRPGVLTIIKAGKIEEIDFNKSG